MNLQELIEQYITFRRSLGELQGSNAGTLRAFGRSVNGEIDVAAVSVDQVNNFLAGNGPITLTWHIKLSVLRPFFNYALSRSYISAMPLPTVIPKRPPAFVAHIYTRKQLRRILDVASEDRHPQSCLEPVTIKSIIVLLYGAGLRLQEALNLTHADIDLSASLLTVRQSKFGKTRLVPVGTELNLLLAEYAARSVSAEPSDPFFITKSGDRVKADTLQHNYRMLCEEAGVRREEEARYQPRLHDLRHSFAVHRLVAWYSQGADVQQLLPLLSVYLGHVHIRATQVYLTMTPELSQEASIRFAEYTAQEVEHE